MSAGKTPTPSADTRLFLLDQDGILFHEAQQKLYALNTLAVVIWIYLEEGLEQREIVTRLEEEHGLESGQAADYLRDILASWESLGLLAGHYDSLDPVPAGRRASPLVDAASRPDSGPPAHRFRCSCLDVNVDIHCASESIHEKVYPILAHFTVEASEDTADVIIELDEGDQGIDLYENGEPVNHVPGLDALGPAAKGLFLRGVVNRQDYLVHVHAGVVGNGETCILLPAAAGSGKSTLTAGLVAAGYDYLSDESALLHLPDLCVRPLPLALCSKSTGWEVMVIDALCPANASLTIHDRVDDKRVRYLTPSLLGSVAEDRPYPVSHIIFPRYSATGGISLRPLPRSRALSLLFEDCLSMPHWLSPDSVASIVDWVRRVDCYELALDDLASGVAAVQQVFPRLSRRAAEDAPAAAATGSPRRV
jgi:hypothetical protein